MNEQKHKSALREELLDLTPRQRKYLLGMEFLALVVEEVSKGEHDDRLGKEYEFSIAGATDICVKIAEEEFSRMARSTAESFKRGETPQETVAKVVENIKDEEILATVKKIWSKGDI